MIAVMSADICDAFNKATGIEAHSLKPYLRLDKPVSSHSDMLLCVIEDTVFCYEDYYYDNIEAFKRIECEGKKVVFVSAKCGAKYPNDIALNVLIMGKNIFCNTSSTAKEIIDFALKNGYKITDVKQGYSACSTLVINDNLAITGDKGMKKAIESTSKTAILVDNSKIILKGYNCGFIGGAGGVFDKTIYFFGPKSYFEDYPQILQILSYEKIEIKSIIPDRVYDFGGIKFF